MDGGTRDVQGSLRGAADILDGVAVIGSLGGAVVGLVVMFGDRHVGMVAGAVALGCSLCMAVLVLRLSAALRRLADVTSGPGAAVLLVENGRPVLDLRDR